MRQCRSQGQTGLLLLLLKGSVSLTLYLLLDCADQAQRLNPWNGSDSLPAAPAISCQVHPSTALHSWLLVTRPRSKLSNACCCYYSKRDSRCLRVTLTGNLSLFFSRKPSYTLHLSTFLSSCCKENGETHKTILVQTVRMKDFCVKGAFNCVRPREENVHDVEGVYKTTILWGGNPEVLTVEPPSDLLK